MKIARWIGVCALLSTAQACLAQTAPKDGQEASHSDPAPACTALPASGGSANPASVYCASLGYRSDGDACVFPDGTKCEQWAFYRGQCGGAHSFCDLHGGTVSSKTEDMGTWTAIYAVCTLANGQQCHEDSFAHTCRCETAPVAPDAGPSACTALPASGGSTNPASVYCVSLGYGVDGDACVFPDGTKCEQWAFYRGQCGGAHSFCNLHGGTVSSKTEDMGSSTAVYAVCTLGNGQQCHEDSFAHTCRCE